jgi:hypothetical protein
VPFWLLVLILITLIALCWGLASLAYYGGAANRPVAAACALLGLILFVILVVVFFLQGGPLEVRR